MNSLKKIFDLLNFNKKIRKTRKNKVYEIHYNPEKTVDVLIPKIQNKSFKVSKWFVKVGAKIKKNQIICELESDSISLEFDSQIEGKLVFITSKQGFLSANEILCKIETF